jgi:hypothetical protein
MSADYSLECEDEYGVQSVMDRQDLLEWLDSWLSDGDSTTCRLTKLPGFRPQHYQD